MWDGAGLWYFWRSSSGPRLQQHPDETSRDVGFIHKHEARLRTQWHDMQEEEESELATEGEVEVEADLGGR